MTTATAFSSQSVTTLALAETGAPMASQAPNMMVEVERLKRHVFLLEAVADVTEQCASPDDRERAAGERYRRQDR
jgi:hypothetical protein